MADALPELVCVGGLLGVGVEVIDVNVTFEAEQAQGVSLRVRLMKIENG